MYKVNRCSIMATYIAKVMRDGKRVQLEKPYWDGIVVRNYPQKSGGAYLPHIFIPVEIFNERMDDMIEKLGMNVGLTRHKGFVVSFPKSRCYTLQDSIVGMETLKPIVQILNRLR